MSVLHALHERAGNRWYAVPGARPDAVIVGSHIDAATDGGRLDGTLGLLAGFASLRELARTELPVTVGLVDWGDEEGACFGRSWSVSGCAAGTIRPDDVRPLRDTSGTSRSEALAACGVDLAAAPLAVRELDGARAYVEPHLERGSVLGRRGRSVGVVTGTLGVERHACSFRGRTPHAGATPMGSLADASLPAAETAPAVRKTAVRHGGVGTVGPVRVHPACRPSSTGKPRSRSTCVRPRWPRSSACAPTSTARRGATARWASRRPRCSGPPRSRSTPRSSARPKPPASRSLAGSAHRLTRGARHGATEVARRVPAALLFALGVGGVSHSAEEHTRPEDVRVAVRALTARVIEDVGSPPTDPAGT